MSQASLSADDQLIQAAGEFYSDPLGFVLYAYPWGEPGALRDHPGPDAWQRDFLSSIGSRPFRYISPICNRYSPSTATSRLCPSDPIQSCNIPEQR